MHTPPAGGAQGFGAMMVGVAVVVMVLLSVLVPLDVPLVVAVRDSDDVAVDVTEVDTLLVRDVVGEEVWVDDAEEVTDDAGRQLIMIVTPSVKNRFHGFAADWLKLPVRDMLDITRHPHCWQASSLCARVISTHSC